MEDRIPCKIFGIHCFHKYTVTGQTKRLTSGEVQKTRHPANTVTKDEPKTDVGKINSLAAAEFIKRSPKSKQAVSPAFNFTAHRKGGMRNRLRQSQCSKPPTARVH